ncbi:hypothetical protein B0J12DRAFT_362658 [Macrophomina phaseolina]|uniref:Uncharacterized protein n=1 Tax=Macrophomina phaseolina TaxID=35725 RepID=A0ABQ8FWI3_9PEZI|nr:hypothetical protein B0J12DRAFT_362658 [Macrophomina phaseolina]
MNIATRTFHCAIIVASRESLVLRIMPPKRSALQASKRSSRTPKPSMKRKEASQASIPPPRPKKPRKGPPKDSQTATQLMAAASVGVEDSLPPPPPWTQDSTQEATQDLQEPQDASQKPSTALTRVVRNAVDLTREPLSYSQCSTQDESQAPPPRRFLRESLADAFDDLMIKYNVKMSAKIGIRVQPMYTHTYTQVSCRLEPFFEAKILPDKQRLLRSHHPKAGLYETDGSAVVRVSHRVPGGSSIAFSLLPGSPEWKAVDEALEDFANRAPMSALLTVDLMWRYLEGQARIPAITTQDADSTAIVLSTHANSDSISTLAGAQDELAAAMADTTGYSAIWSTITHEWRCTSTSCRNHDRWCFLVGQEHIPLTGTDMRRWAEAIGREPAVTTAQPPASLLWSSFQKKELKTPKGGSSAPLTPPTAINIYQTPGSSSQERPATPPPLLPPLDDQTLPSPVNLVGTVRDRDVSDLMSYLWKLADGEPRKTHILRAEELLIDSCEDLARTRKKPIQWFIDLGVKEGIADCVKKEVKPWLALRKMEENGTQLPDNHPYRPTNQIA